MLIGVVGKSGSGKSTLVKRMQEFNKDIVHVDIDKIGQDILRNSEVINNIVRIVGSNEVIENGALNRRKVGNIIFNDKEKYENYFKYTEDIEYEIIDDIISKNKDKIVVLDWAVLFKTKYYNLLDYKIFVNTEDKVRKNRVIKRDNISEEYFNLREMMYNNYDISNMDFIIDGNNYSVEDIKKILGELKWGKRICL